MKNNNRSQRKVSKKAGQTQPRQRASASADETVIIQITHEDGREWARVPFSRLEHSALKAVCDLRDCTMQELFNEAVATDLDRRGVTPTPAPQPGIPAIEQAEQTQGNAAATPSAKHDERRHRLADIEEDIAEASAMVKLLGEAVGGYHQNAGRRNGGRVCLGLSLLSTKLADDLEDHWDAAFQVDVQPDEQQARHCEELLLRNLHEAAAFTHAACLALGDIAAFTHPTDWKQMGEAYAALGRRLSLRVLAIVDAATPPARQAAPSTVKAEVAA